jgi:tetratricopeptide (TPR) repeat protein
VLAKTYLAWAQWLLGHPDRALAHSQEAGRAARDLGEPYNIAVASFNVGLIHQWRREPNAAQSSASVLVALCTEHGFSFLHAAATELHGAALVEQGESDRGLALLRQGWAAHRGTGAELGGTYWRAELADACMRSGAFDEASQILLEALNIARERAERIWQCELYRLYGELCRQAPERAPALPELGFGDSSGAERAFVYAIELARATGARSHELRASISLARLWSSRGNQAAAHDLLAGVVQHFDGGQQTGDLRDACALSRALASPPTRAAI